MPPNLEIVCQSVTDKRYDLERNNSIYRLKFLSYNSVNTRQSAGKELHNVSLESATLERVGNTTRKVPALERTSRPHGGHPQKCHPT